MAGRWIRDIQPEVKGREVMAVTTLPRLHSSPDLSLWDIHVADLTSRWAGILIPCLNYSDRSCKRSI